MSCDYLIIGGGLAGCVAASRLKEYRPSSSVTLVEAGPDEHANPLITEPQGTFQLHGSSLQYNYSTVPQEHYDGRRVYNAGGRMLSGSTSCNYAYWMRGAAEDYDAWAEHVDDPSWSYAGQLPYFMKTETHHDAKADHAVHGFSGPVQTAPVDREYPLKEPFRLAFERLGLEVKGDGNDGHPAGVTPYTENWRKGKRQPAGRAYNLGGVKVMTGQRVTRLVLVTGDDSSGKLVATGAQLENGLIIKAAKEVILACGAIRTP